MNGTTELNFTTHETALRLRVSVRTLANWRYQGVGPRFLKLPGGLNGKIVYPLREIEAFEKDAIKNNSVQTSPITKVRR